MTLARTTCAAVFEAVANDARVRRGLGHGVAPLSLQAVVGDPRNVALADGENGGFVFENLGDGRFELHTLLDAAVRGAAALDLAARAMAWGFANTDATAIVTRTPGNLRHAALMARRAGFAPLHTARGAWPGPDGPTDLTFYAMSRRDWAARQQSQSKPEN